MRYERISADCHVDLCWLPPDLFTINASAALRDRMPYVTDGPKGRMWTTKRGASLGMMNGMGSAGRQYVPGKIHRADRMAATGLYDDGLRGIRRLTDPNLRVKDQDRDGVQAEVLYGVPGAGSRLNDPEAAVEVMRVYNEWLADFCGGAGALRGARVDSEQSDRRRHRRGRAGGQRGAAPDSISPTLPISSRCGIPTGIRSGRS
jgi:hypothetical protein